MGWGRCFSKGAFPSTTEWAASASLWPLRSSQQYPKLLPCHPQDLQARKQLCGLAQKLLPCFLRGHAWSTKNLAPLPWPPPQARPPLRSWVRQEATVRWLLSLRAHVSCRCVQCGPPEQGGVHPHHAGRPRCGGGRERHAGRGGAVRLWGRQRQSQSGWWAPFLGCLQAQPECVPSGGPGWPCQCNAGWTPLILGRVPHPTPATGVPCLPSALGVLNSPCASSRTSKSLPSFPALAETRPPS